MRMASMKSMDLIFDSKITCINDNFFWQNRKTKQINKHCVKYLPECVLSSSTFNRRSDCGLWSLFNANRRRNKRGKKIQFFSQKNALLFKNIYFIICLNLFIYFCLSAWITQCYFINKPRTWKKSEPQQKHQNKTLYCLSQ